MYTALSVPCAVGEAASGRAGALGHNAYAAARGFAQVRVGLAVAAAHGSVDGEANLGTLSTLALAFALEGRQVAELNGAAVSVDGAVIVAWRK